MIYFMIGIPGSGKTTLAKEMRIDLGAYIISSDEIRIKYLRDKGYDDVFHPLNIKGISTKEANKMESEIWEEIESEMDIAVRDKEPSIIDATNVSWKYLSQWITRVKRAGNDYRFVVMETAYMVCVERNKRRERTVDESVLQDMWKKYDHTLGKFVADSELWKRVTFSLNYSH